MPDDDIQKLTDVALAHARALGADLAGAASWAEVMAGPSYAIQPLMPSWDGVGAGHPGRPPAPDGPAQPQTLVVVGVALPANRLALDWWRSDIPSRTQGNVILARIVNGLARWLRETHGVMAWDLAYHVERGGIFLKDAAVAAGLGTVGANNLFLAPALGPRVRLRAVAVAVALAPPRHHRATNPARSAPCPAARLAPRTPLVARPWPQVRWRRWALRPRLACPPGTGATPASFAISRWRRTSPPAAA